MNYTNKSTEMLYPFRTIKVVVFEVLSENHECLCGQQHVLCGFIKSFISAIVILDIHCSSSVQILLPYRRADDL